MSSDAEQLRLAARGLFDYTRAAWRSECRPGTRCLGVTASKAAFRTVAAVEEADVATSPTSDERCAVARRSTGRARRSRGGSTASAVKTQMA